MNGPPQNAKLMPIRAPSSSVSLERTPSEERSIYPVDLNLRGNYKLRAGGVSDIAAFITVRKHKMYN